jgi:hypothetical protein
MGLRAAFCLDGTGVGIGLERDWVVCDESRGRGESAGVDIVAPPSSSMDSFSRGVVRIMFRI